MLDQTLLSAFAHGDERAISHSHPCASRGPALQGIRLCPLRPQRQVCSLPQLPQHRLGSHVARGSTAPPPLAALSTLSLGAARTTLAKPAGGALRVHLSSSFTHYFPIKFKPYPGVWCLWWKPELMNDVLSKEPRGVLCGCIVCYNFMCVSVLHTHACVHSCVCVFVFVCVSVCACMLAYTLVCPHVHVCVRSHAFLGAFM